MCKSAFAEFYHFGEPSPVHLRPAVEGLHPLEPWPDVVVEDARPLVAKEELCSAPPQLGLEQVQPRVHRLYRLQVHGLVLVAQGLVQRAVDLEKKRSGNSNKKKPILFEIC